MALTNDYEMQSYAGTFISGGAAYNLVIPFEPHMLKLYNYTKAGTAGEPVHSVWFNGMPAGDGIVQQVIADNGATGNTNTILETTNGFTEANVAAGVDAYRATITGATQASPVVITATAHGFGSAGDVLRARITKVIGMTELNDNEYQITIVDANSFSLQDPHTGDAIDGTGFTAYSSSGQANLITRTTDNSKAVETDPIQYRITLGTAVVGNDSDVYYFEAYRYNKYEDLGDIG